MQGFNMGRYVPPDQEGLVSSGNALLKKHPLGSRASKLSSHGILTVRFEIPFPIWCAHCPKPTIIPQGVRFNAGKKRTGSYYTTPIFSFFLKHPSCGGEIEIRTDPKNTDYVVVSGARRRDTPAGDSDDLISSGGVIILTDREKAESREASFGKLEKTIADREQLLTAKVRIDELQETSERQWDDPYSQNRRLRAAFRVGRREREAASIRTESLQEKMGLGIELLPESQDDTRRAALIEFGGGVDEDTEEGDKIAEKALAKPLFGSSTELVTAEHKKPQKKMLKTEMAASKIKKSLVSEIVSNTRAARDPFLGFGDNNNNSNNNHTQKGNGGGGSLLPGLKRKRTEDITAVDADDIAVPAVKHTKFEKRDGSPKLALVSYDSDSD
ncbi:hypothetical protein QBC35DRAFT_499239 [Podospora australis]|uniref:Coiled-coil domain-containing protein n=1 Tax=Podospora australis TaxID=1536484 RepID=A0AAN6WT24_9PEZI|nr:hypothetical protein QBC35DRAFT_499239 [Podospora australis]